MGRDGKVPGVGGELTGAKLVRRGSPALECDASPHNQLRTTNSRRYFLQSHTKPSEIFEERYHSDISAMSNIPRSHTPGGSRLSTVPSQKPRQLSHLQAQLAQLTANMSDLESLMRMTAGQAQDMRGLGGYVGAM
jgi:hypothetical protein